jgi:uncharacterized damage-inducible protein DinB
MDLVQHLRIQAHANRLANRRLHEAMMPLSRDDFHAARTSFFPSFALTLNHILVVDRYYIGALCREPELQRKRREFQPCDTMAELALEQAASDMRLIAFCNALDAEGADAMIDMDRGTYVQKERAGHVLAHLFMHQTHHRGQAHAMLSGTAIEPPQLDEFLMPSEAKFRVADMAVLGWTEEEVFGGTMSVLFRRS